MESSDFNAVANWLHDALSVAVERRSPLAQVFVGFELDPLGPGHVLSASTVSLSHPLIATAVDRHVAAADADMPHNLVAEGAMDRAAMALLLQTGSAYGIVANCRPAAIQERRGIALRLFSSDRCLATMFLMNQDAKGRIQLRYEAPKIHQAGRWSPQSR